MLPLIFKVEEKFKHETWMKHVANRALKHWSIFSGLHSVLSQKIKLIITAL
jgi:hypothetical protein